MSKESRITFSRAKSLIDYDPMAGTFTWRVTYSRAKAGDAAGYVNSNGYAVVGIDGEKVRLHRLAWLLSTGAWPEHTIDHIDGDRLNNRLSNLRDVPQAINMQNIRKPTRANTSGVLGVYWSEYRQGWMASINAGGRKLRAGPFKTRDRAVAARQRLKAKWHADCPDVGAPGHGSCPAVTLYG